MRNLLTDIEGVSVGHATDLRLGSGVTAILFDRPAVASVAILGGAPGTRDTALLDPAATVERVDAIILSGGSTFGLDAGGGAQAALRETGRGFLLGAVRDHLRSGQWRGQGLGPVSAVPRPRVCGIAGRGGGNVRARHGRRGHRRHHGDSEGWPRFGEWRDLDGA